MDSLLVTCGQTLKSHHAIKFFKPKIPISKEFNAYLVQIIEDIPSKDEVIKNPQLLLKWCTCIAKLENINPHEMSRRAIEEFSNNYPNWSEGKIRYYLDDNFKNQKQQQNALQRKTRLTKKQYLKKHAKILAIGIKNDWIDMAKGEAVPVSEVETFIDKT